MKNLGQKVFTMRLIKRLVLVLVVGICSFTDTYGQQDPHYTQYMYNTISVNPAYAGSRDYSVITALGRIQWVGIEGAPDTQTLSYDAPLGSGLGLGISLVNDAIGPSNETSVDANLSYSVRTSDTGNLAFGLKLGGRWLNIDWSKGLFKDQNDTKFNSGNINKVLPTVGAGLYYYTEKFYAGLSVPNFLRTSHYDDKINGGDVAVERMHFFGIFGYVFDLSQDIKFKPAVLGKAVFGAPLSIDVSANFLFNDKFTAGVAWRWDDSLSAMLGFQATRGLYLGYGYDLTTSNYSNYNSGSHEIMLRYSFIPDTRLKSPRFF